MRLMMVYSMDTDYLRMLVCGRMQVLAGYYGY